MAYTKSQREEIVRNNTAFRDQIAGCLHTHARFLYDTDHETRPAGELRQVLSVLANPWPHVESAGRAVIYYPSQDSLSDITALDDAAVLALIPSVWPMLVAAWSGEVVTP